MPLSYAPATTAQLASGRSAERDMVLFDFPSGLWGFWSGFGTLTFQGVTYVGAGALLDLSNLQESTELASRKLTLKLRAIPDTALTPDVLATIEAEQYHQRPVTLMTAYLNPDTGALVSVEVVMRGIVDRMLHREDPDAVLECSVETRTRDITKTGVRKRTVEDQKRIDPTDTGFRHIATVHTETIRFGRLDPASQWWKDTVTAKKKKKGIFG
jgi:hypothetical protein